MKHWNAQEQGACVWDEDGRRVATVHTGNKADAVLIAAAPRLRAFAENVRAAVAENGRDANLDNILQAAEDVLRGIE
jgi:hypothetical protein